MQETLNPEEARASAGKYLTFGLAGDEYGLEILKVREIVGMMTVTAVPQTPEYVRGVVNLRGKVIPVIDLRAKFNMPAAQDTEESCIIVVDLGTRESGIVVDRVSEVLNVSADQIEPTPEFGASVRTDFILGIGKTGDRVTLLLDIDRIVDRNDLDGIA